jgi:alpha-D-ribose 1-methylphosphonate 5-triphosphate synthase subunit PhnH
VNARDLLPGFADLVHDSQATFRVLLAALAEPGTVQVAPVALAGPDPLGPALTAALLTLADLETPVWLDIKDAIAAGRVARYLAFHCGCTCVDVTAAATFAVLTHPQ